MKIVNKISDQLLFRGGFDITKVEFNLQSQFINKPKRALWTSTLNENNSSDWECWCKAEDFPVCTGDIEKWILVPKKDLKIVEIGDDTDLEDLPLVDYICGSIVFDDRKLIDFQKLADDGYDGLHLTERGACLSRGLYLLHNSLPIIDFSGWDCESTCWFNVNWIDSVIKLK